jgi:hypothetical protein
MRRVSTLLGGARGFNRHPLAPHPHPRSAPGRVEYCGTMWELLSYDW